MYTNLRKQSRANRYWPLILVLVSGVVASSALAAYRWNRETPAAADDYKAVLLANGQVYIGKLTNLGEPFAVLREVYYVHAEADEGGRQMKNVLLKRGANEWHNPDRMLISAAQIVLVEPVAPGSLVAERIRDLNKVLADQSTKK